MNTPADLQRIYRERFDSRRTYREQVWRTLIDGFFGRWIPEGGSVLDLGFGYGEFIRLARCKHKYAMDLNPDGAAFVPPGCTVLTQDCSAPWPLPAESLDLVFTSNFFEHLPDKAALGRTLDHALTALRPGGRLIAMGPNIAQTGGRYWHFWDHYLPLTEKSLKEALATRGFIIRKCLPAFLPYTMVDKRETPAWIIALYLRLPWVWRFFGEQFLLIAEKPTTPPPRSASAGSDH